jgi:hypothetical protein
MDLVPGLAQHLAASGIGVWKDTGVYTTADLAIVDTVVPQSPENVITLTQYPVAHETHGTGSTFGIQVRARTAGRDPRTTKNLLQSVHDLLDGATHLDLAGVPVVQVAWQSGSWFGPDGNGRHEAADNYYIQVVNPTANRTD